MPLLLTLWLGCGPADGPSTESAPAVPPAIELGTGEWDWEALEEETNAPPPMTMVGEATIAAEGEEDVPSTFEASSADEAAREEERQLTAASLNDLFYLVDAQADVVNQLEEIFAGDDADKEEEEEELDADDEEKARQLEDIRKIFEIFDERGEGNEDEAPKDEEESFDPNA